MSRATAALKPRRSRTRRARRLAVVAALAVMPALIPVAAQAAPVTAHGNVLSGFCSAHHRTACVAVADDDSGVLTIVGATGRHHTFRTAVAALRYLDVRATHCVQEDSAACVWNAGSVGNHAGSSFVVIGGKAEGTGTVWYLDSLS